MTTNNKYTNLLSNLTNNKKNESTNKKVDSSYGKEIREYKKRDANKRAELEGTKVVLHFPYSIENLGEVKAINGRKYDPKTKTWKIKISLIVLKELDRLGYTFSKELERKYEVLLDKVGTFDISKVKFDTNNIKTPKGLSLRDYQIESLKFIEGRKGKAILALDQGLGKSIIISTYINYHPEIKPVIIVCPASLKYNWVNELNKWAPKRKIEILEGKKSKKLKKTSDIIIINYDILDSWKKQLSELKPELLVLDECQNIKSIKGVKRSKASKSLAKHCKRIIPLSGTPIINKAQDLFNILNMVEPEMFNSATEFCMRFGDPEFNGFGYQFKGVSNAEELNAILSNVMIRYKKCDVLNELPDRTFTYIPLDIDNRKEYDKAENDFIGYVRENKGNRAANKIKYAEALVKIGTLRQLAAKGALNNAISYIKDKLETTNEKIIIFAIHREIINALEEEFKDICVKIDGTVSTGSVRQELVDKFQKSDKIRLFIGNIKACGSGLNLQAATITIFLQLPWTNADLQQAMDRNYRIGTKNNVNVIYLLPINTIEYKLANIINEKADIASKIIDGVDIEENNSVLALMKEYE